MKKNDQGRIQKITFDGHVDEAVLADFRAVFLSLSRPATVFYGAIALGFLALGITTSDAASRIFLILVAPGVLVARYSRPRIAWKQNVRAWQDVLAMHFTGTISDTEVRLNGVPEPAPVPWRKFIAMEQSDRALLLYLSQDDCLPFHRFFFAEQSDWDDFVALARGRIKSQRQVPGKSGK
ncbi:MAG TPA: hypothetical protein VH394_12430 [Thermoanaerobaculia bacterium]|jgi:hypothetical protein|nr:hypothetical protein [Thermoanaerobaculia bacterium]